VNHFTNGRQTRQHALIFSPA